MNPKHAPIRITASMIFSLLAIALARAALADDDMAESIRNMKHLAFSLLFFHMWVASGQDQWAQTLTNDVPITDYGIRFGLSDNSWEAPNEQAIFERKELLADKRLTWFLRNTSSNRWNSVIFLGMSNSFAFDLKTPNGISIPKTEKGKAMNAGPASLTNPRDNKFVRREGTGFSDFPKLTELFNFPSNGVYVLEIRYWTWNNQDRFSLSNPVRMKVIKQISTNEFPAPVTSTNTPSTNRQPMF